METVSYKTEKKETENGIEETKTVSIEFSKEGHETKLIRFERKEGVTTISVSREIDDPHEEVEHLYFESTIEDEKLKQAASYMGEMFLNVGKLALMKFINESKEENS